MNPFLNPFITIPFLKNYIIDPGRIERYSPKELERYKDKKFRKILSYAYSVPLYKKKYKDAGIKLNDIKGIKDIKKLPFVTRKEFTDNFPDGIVPPNFDKEKGHVICTGGTTSKYCCNSGAEPVCIYTDFPSMLHGLNISVRQYRFYNLNLKKTKFAHLGNYNPFKFDSVYDEHIMENIKPFYSNANYLSMNASDPIQNIIEKLDSYRPDVIISYPVLFQELAYIKRKGLGKKINPKLLIVGGAMLDDYTRRYVEDAFRCRMLNSYASCEAGFNIAFECEHGGWHIHSDYFHIETIDENLEPVAPGERGHIVLTKLWGTGTPIIRYTGMKDWITLGNGKKCECGHNGPIFDKPVEGRVASNIILPNGCIYPPSSFLFITEILKNLNTFKVKQYQILQKKIDEIYIYLVIDDDLRNNGPSINKMIGDIKKIYQKKTEPGITINVIEVDKIEDDPETGKPAPLVVSNVSINECKLRNN
jgi:phenylacetate-CoA ligase